MEKVREGCTAGIAADGALLGDKRKKGSHGDGDNGDDERAEDEDGEEEDEEGGKKGQKRTKRRVRKLIGECKKCLTWARFKGQKPRWLRISHRFS